MRQVLRALIPSAAAAAIWAPPLLPIGSDMRRLDELGVDVVRAHYPLHAATLDALDRRGVLVWSQAPVYQLPEASLARRAVRARARAANRETVLRDRNHPSVFVWSMANELPELVGPGQAAFIRGTARSIRRLDPSRMVVIDRSTRVKGTFAFQTRWLRDHLAAHDARPFVNGSIVWALRDFRVHPGWAGGNPVPNPPWNDKGLLEDGGAPKPAFHEAKRLFHAAPALR